MLPQDWEFRLVNRNTEDLATADLDWADMVMTGGMLFQQADSLRMIELCRKHGKPVVVGGPDVTSSPHVYKSADFQVLGEAERRHRRISSPRGRRGSARACSGPRDFRSTSPRRRCRASTCSSSTSISTSASSISRGCPFTCEFCDIIELYGRVPRTKTNEQMLAELQRLYELGYRGHVDFVDDNLIGNKKSLRTFLPVLKSGRKQHGYPFEFSTEASHQSRRRRRTAAADAGGEFLGGLRRHREPGSRDAGADAQEAEHPAQHRRERAQDLRARHRRHRRIHRRLRQREGLHRRLDGRPSSRICAVPVAMVGLLYALPGTQLTAASRRKAACTPATTSCARSAPATSARSASTSTPVRPMRDMLHRLQARAGNRLRAGEFRAAGWKSSPSCSTAASAANTPVAGDRRGETRSTEMIHSIINAVPGSARNILEDVQTMRPQKSAMRCATSSC